MSKIKISKGQVKTVTEIVKRIKSLESIITEYSIRKKYRDAERVKGKVAQLYWVLGVKTQ